MGAFFIKASKGWARTFRRIPAIKKHPVVEVALVASITGVLSFWNIYTKLPVTELLFELASPCGPNDTSQLCPKDKDQVREILGVLCIAFLIKGFLTTITFGIKVPAGIYVPSMVVGGFLGRIIGHLVQYLVFVFPKSPIFASCPASGGPESCITPGVYALVAAGATMCGVTRLSVTLVVILFELTGSLDHVLPFSLSVLVAKWTADALEPLSVYVRFSIVTKGVFNSLTLVGYADRDELISFLRQQGSACLHHGVGGHYSSCTQSAHHRHICLAPRARVRVASKVIVLAQRWGTRRRSSNSTSRCACRIDPCS